MSSQTGDEAASSLRNTIRRHQRHRAGDRPPGIRYCRDPDCVTAVKAAGCQPDLTYMNLDEYMRDVGEPTWNRLLEKAGFTPEPFSRPEGIPAAEAAGDELRNTAVPSAELPAGDIVSAGEVALAVARPAGREPASGPLTGVRTREHGTSPLHGRVLGSGPGPDPRKENHGE